MLEIKNASIGYKGGVLAVQDISFTVKKGEVVSLIGSNGAGKSTVLRAISGLLRLRAGEILSTERPSTPFRRTTSCGGGSPWCRRDASSSADSP